MDVGDRRLVEEVTETLLTRVQCLARLLERIAHASLLLFQFRNLSRSQLVAKPPHLFVRQAIVQGHRYRAGHLFQKGLLQMSISSFCRRHEK